MYCGWQIRPSSSSTFRLSDFQTAQRLLLLSAFQLLPQSELRILRFLETPHPLLRRLAAYSCGGAGGAAYGGRHHCQALSVSHRAHPSRIREHPHARGIPMGCHSRMDLRATPRLTPSHPSKTPRLPELLLVLPANRRLRSRNANPSSPKSCLLQSLVKHLVFSYGTSNRT